MAQRGARASSGLSYLPNGDGNSCRGVKGMLIAFDAEDVTKELWRSQGKDANVSDTKDSFGLLSRFIRPRSPTEKSSWAPQGMPNRFSVMAVPGLRRPGPPITTWRSTD